MATGADSEARHIGAKRRHKGGTWRFGIDVRTSHSSFSTTHAGSRESAVAPTNRALTRERVRYPPTTATSWSSARTRTVASSPNESTRDAASAAAYSTSPNTGAQRTDTTRNGAYRAPEFTTTTEYDGETPVPTTHRHSRSSSR